MLSTRIRESESKMDEDLTPRRRNSRERRGAAPWNVRLSLLLLFFIVTGGLLAFGAVDRAVQIPLIILLGVGLALHPPRVMNLPVWVSRLMLGLVTILVLKELLPANWFGLPAWRTTIMQDYGVRLPDTHHPEPGRALDGWLTGLVGLMWFSWVRALAVEREDRVKVAWIFVVAAAAVSLASFGLSSISKEYIFGLRFTPEWFGFGPFPNRNHTGSLFAMAAILGIGCVAHAGAQKRFDLVCAGLLLVAAILTGLMRTQSRGALLALAVGLVVFAIGMVAKAQTRKATAIAVGIILLLGAVALIAGDKTVARLVATKSQGVTEDSARTRIAIWRDTLSMVKDAPLLGSGAGSFQSVFPFYQNIEVEDVAVKHPESSVLQWLAEFGALPFSIIGLLAGAFLVPHVRYAFERRSSFLIAVGAFGAVAVLLAHSFVDVPAHRWGTLAFALAALAIACPPKHESETGSRRAALIPLGVAGIWILPLVFNGPAWSPFQLDRVLSAGAMHPQAFAREVQTSLRWFALNPKLHMLYGQVLELTGAKPSEWQKEYRIAARLVPSAWKICAQIALRCQETSPSIALHYWQMSVDRASLHRVDAFKNAIKQTAGIRTAADTWQSYLDVHPELLLTYAHEIPEAERRQYFNLWWERRGSKPEPVTASEAEDFIKMAGKWSTPEQMALWVQLPNRPKVGVRELVDTLRKKGDFEQAWQIASLEITEPEYPTDLPRDVLSELQKRYEKNPEDPVNARSYAHVLHQDGEREEEVKVIKAAAKDANPPRWFAEKGAYVLAREKRYEEAVDLVLDFLEK
jgi:O-antigen ligase